VRLFVAALRCEILKARRSKVPLWTAAGFSLAPLMGGLFMFIMKDPARARAMGLLGTKAQITAGTADWPTFLGVIAQATAVGGSFIFALVTAWVFGREFADRTVKLLLAVPTPRGAILTAKFVVVAAWSALLSAWIFGIALLVGFFLDLPGWSGAMLRLAALDVAMTAALAILLQSPAAFLASAGRGYLAPLGFAILTVFLAQITAATGWGGWFPWSVPALFTGMAGPRASLLGAPSYALVALTSLAGVAATFVWWQRADHTT
jgi:ABC-2 type transport system permease protein